MINQHWLAIGCHFFEISGKPFESHSSPSQIEGQGSQGASGKGQRTKIRFGKLLHRIKR